MTYSRKISPRLAAACIAATVLFAGCNKKADNTLNYLNAVNTYYSAHPACLWASSQQFPQQAGTSDHEKTMPLDALVDQGLLVRSTADKKVMIIVSKQFNNYDLSDKGRSAWTPDSTQPGFGNFCYGHRKATAIDSATPTSDQPGATTQVSYHYTFGDAPAWATAAETQNAYPDLHTNLSGPHTDTATLTNTSNGWTLSTPSTTP
ncbi:MAG: hypothetical protein PW789_09845 [Edaphobacter sp.]|uniref:hypothetical protein n=1 Tax=Edaphobacter sp. TaxID=1934404 RepID=UPI002389DEAC|nr:hypothetical protein [Edaphobacter sp.]MDE1176894.1 hypothetical protein [Edaphobacter sp.]